MEHNRILTHTLELWRGQGDDSRAATALGHLSDANRLMGLYKEGIQQAREASEIFERLGNTVKQAECLINLAFALHDNKQLNAAEKAASRAIDLLEKGEQPLVCEGHRILGNIYNSKGDTEKAIHHLEVALKIASALNQDYQLFWVHFTLVQLFAKEDRFGNAQAHIECAKPHAINNTYQLGRVVELQACLWYDQCMFEKARSKASYAADVFEKLGAAHDLGRCRELLQQIDEQLDNPVVSDESDTNGELLETLPPATCINVSFKIRELNESLLPRFLQRDPCAIHQRPCPLTNPSLRHILLYSHYVRTFPLPPIHFHSYTLRIRCPTFHDILRHLYSSTSRMNFSNTHTW